VSGRQAAAQLGKPPISDADRDAFLARVPVREALAHGRALGPVVMAGAGELAEPRVAVAVAFAGVDGRYLLAADLSLARLSARLATLSRGGVEVRLVDRERRGVAGGATPGAERRAAGGFPPVALPGDRDPTGPLPAKSQVATVRPPGGGTAALAAFAPAPDWGVGVLVSQPETAAFAHAAELRRRTLYWLVVAAAVAAVVGVSLARDVGKRIALLGARTDALARGDFHSRLDAGGADELAGLARSFNKMAADLGTAADELRRRAAEIEAKNEEISAWNRELERRVEDKTRELRRAEEALLRARSLAAVGTLGAGMAHEINNPLTGILGAAQLMLADTPEDAPVRPLLVDVEQQAQRIRAIVANLLAMAERERNAGAETVDLNQIVRDALELARPELVRSKVDVVTELAPTLPAVRGDARRLEEVVIELCENARRAMPDGGRLTIVTASPSPTLASLRVRDTGVGITAEMQEKIFDPFFTTKSHWRATGMGLTMVHKVVEEHRGQISVDSRPGEGATFTIDLPAAAAQTAHLA
jgi:signal transduction histidine kinase